MTALCAAGASSGTAIHGTPNGVGAYGVFQRDGQISTETLTDSYGDLTVGCRRLAAPEPSTWAMMELGFAGLGLARSLDAEKRLTSNV
jgi:hypothetical protein